MEPRKRFVYVLKSEDDPKRHYTGLTSDIAVRLHAHNAGRCPHTASGKPWIIDVTRTSRLGQEAEVGHDPNRSARVAPMVSRFVRRSHIQRQEVEMAEIAARRWLLRGLAMMVTALVATTASAQSADTAPRMPVWDASVSGALHNVRASEMRPQPDGLYDYFETQWEPGAQVGRYLTSHLKVELGVRGPMQSSFYETDLVPVPALTGGFGWSSVDVNVRVFSVAPAVTWQFLDNTFAHPYLSVGVAMDVMDVHRFRPARTETDYRGRTGVRYDVPAIDTRDTEFIARPFVAVGSKSYFSNGRWFVRPEIQVGTSKSRVSAVSMRLGVGVDF